MANQFTKGTRKKHDEATKDKIRAELLSQRMYKYAKANGEDVAKYRMENAQVAAARVLIERGKPALQAIEQTVVTEQEAISPEARLELVRSLISSHPEIIAQLNLQPKPLEVGLDQGQMSTKDAQQAA